MSVLLALGLLCGFGACGPGAGSGAGSAASTAGVDFFLAEPGFDCLSSEQTGCEHGWLAAGGTDAGGVVIAVVGADRDPWFGSDKLRHFVTAFAVTGHAQAGLRALDVDRGDAVVGGFVISMVAGFGKEVHDVRRGSFFSLKDLAWDLAGALTGAVLVAAAR
jgi:uncharacterized protein YfiM (DUF2279 family)